MKLKSDNLRTVPHDRGVTVMRAFFSAYASRPVDWHMRKCRKCGDDIQDTAKTVVRLYVCEKCYPC